METQQAVSLWSKVSYTSKNVSGIWIGYDQHMEELVPFNRLLKQPLFEVYRIPLEQLPEFVSPKRKE